ncbi:hypothetical protein GCM10011390_48340 [Aureimonas endophytica]|uniref:Xylose isomerase-like TIM barrel domain-containing protein n=1 Tax=Aureimonas endophytica TaxID=2027858 RepID=A0A917A2K4_9HYPH|nr:TIM barrel protein [Aureimonas endophytica]GGE23260.1 hypothetical protein GCM10011390_48340 [Aureimonas endophytica]
MTPSPIVAVGFNAASADGEFASLEARLRQIAEIGADVAEIAVSSLDIVAGGRIIPERAARLEQLTRSLPLRYTVHGLVASNFMDRETVDRQLAAAKALVEICDRIGSGILVQHSGAIRADQGAERAAAGRLEDETVHALAEFARPYGVRIALENIFTTEPGQWRRSPSELAGAIKAIGHPNLVALIDFSHAYIESTYRGLDFRAELRAMAEVAGHLHVHDSFGQPQGRTPFYFPQEATALGLGDLHMPLGWGDIPFAEIFAELSPLPGTVLMMEINHRYGAEQPACLSEARRFAALVNDRLPAAA